MSKENLEKDLESGEVIKDHNFIISQNRVLFVPKITNKEIKSGGKYCYGEDYHTGASVQILDKDYGKSAELMRALIETENVTPLWKKALILLILGGIVLGIGVVIFSVIPTATAPEIVQEESKKSILPGVPQGNPKQNDNEVPGTTAELPGLPGVEKIENTGPLNNEVLQHTNEIDILKKDYEIESLKLELQRIMDEKNLLTHKNFELEQELIKKDEIIKSLKENTPVCEEKPKDLTQEAFLLHLGTLIYEQCEKTAREDEQNKGSYVGYTPEI